MSPDAKLEDPALQVRPTLDDTTREAIRLKAHRVAQLAGLPRSDLDDLEQDITVHVWQRLGRFDPAKTDDRSAFVRMLVAHATATILRGRVRWARRTPESLEGALRRAGHEERESIDPRTSRRQRESALALDVEAVMNTLPVKLRSVAKTLRTHSVAAAARHLRLSRAEVYRRLAELRRAFAEAGLDKNL
jgi:hypothetical protein